MKRTKAELEEWLRQHPFPKDPTPKESLAWHMAALEYEFGPGYVPVGLPDPLHG